MKKQNHNPLPSPLPSDGRGSQTDKGCPQQILDFYKDLCCGNVEAYQFVLAWHFYCHEIDDVIDTAQWNSEKFLTVLVHAAGLYSMPFYRQHAERLFPHVATVTSMYADSVKWEQADQPLWKRQAADVMRHAGNEMISAVALLTGGYDNVRKFSAALRAMCYVNHHDEYGDPK